MKEEGRIEKGKGIENTWAPDHMYNYHQEVK